MQVKELSADGLKREYQVVVAAQDIEQRVARRLQELSRTVRMAGFRPGKVPVTLLKKQYGRSVMGEILEQAVNEGSQAAISQNELRPALRPKIEVTSFDEGKDLEFSIAVELLPEVPKVDLKGIALTRQTAPVTEAEVEKALGNFAKRLQQFEALAEPRPSQAGDRVTIDFVGRKDGEPFEGGSADDFPLVLGSGAMVPGFEDQLIGVEPGQEVELEVTFPADYPRPDLAGQPAVFTVKVKAVEAPLPIELTDELAKSQGFDDLAALTERMRTSMAAEFGRMARARIKRALLDHLAETVPFGVPAGMVDLEFEAIWKQIEAELKRDPEAAAKPEEELRAEYRAIAERRVRLGLLLSDIGQANEIKVEQAELNAALIEQVRRYPGQEKQVLDFFQKNPQAVEQLRAPIYEDKVVDFILEMAAVTEQEVTPEELMRDPEDGAPAAGAAAAEAEAARSDA
jgi:trigger factor